MAGPTGMQGYASPVSCSMSHRTTNGDFRLGDQRAKVTFFFLGKKRHIVFSNARKQTKCGQFIVEAMLHMCR